jgi:hypothetical protein
VLLPHPDLVDSYTLAPDPQESCRLNQAPAAGQMSHAPA